MLPRLRLDRLVGRDDQQHQIDAADSRQHVAHKALVAGDVHEAQVQRLAVRTHQVEVRKAEVDRDAAPLLFLQPVGIDSGQRLHQGRLPVIDMARRAYDDRFHCQFFANSCQRSAISY